MCYVEPDNSDNSVYTLTHEVQSHSQLSKITFAEYHRRK